MQWHQGHYLQGMYVTSSFSRLVVFGFIGSHFQPTYSSASALVQATTVLFIPSLKFHSAFVFHLAVIIKFWIVPFGIGLHIGRAEILQFQSPIVSSQGSSALQARLNLPVITVNFQVPHIPLDLIHNSHHHHYSVLQAFRFVSAF